MAIGWPSPPRAPRSTPTSISPTSTSRDTPVRRSWYRECHGVQSRRQHPRVRQPRPRGPGPHRHPGNRLLPGVRRIAQQLQDSHKYAEAVPAWQVAAAKDPTDARPFNNMGVASSRNRQDCSEAIEAYKKSLDLETTARRPTTIWAARWPKPDKLPTRPWPKSKGHRAEPRQWLGAHQHGPYSRSPGRPSRGGHRRELTKGIELAPRTPLTATTSMASSWRAWASRRGHRRTPEGCRSCAAVRRVPLQPGPRSGGKQPVYRRAASV
jgi:hypothetical protein